jgi:hypothetical protein
LWERLKDKKIRVEEFTEQREAVQADIEPFMNGLREKTGVGLKVQR